MILCVQVRERVLYRAHSARANLTYEDVVHSEIVPSIRYNAHVHVYNVHVHYMFMYSGTPICGLPEIRTSL